jgi:lipoprotein NlpD
LLPERGGKGKEMTMAKILGGAAGAATAAVRVRARAPAWAGAALLLASLAACSETSLNEAPVVDLSAPAGARGAPAKAPPMAIPASPGETLYTVQKGDTLFHLATRARCTIQDLARWNGIDEHAPIFVGQQLRLQPPATGGATGSAGAAGAPAGAEADSAAPSEAVATPVPLGGGASYETRTLEAPLAPVAPAAAATAPAGTAEGSPAPAAAGPRDSIAASPAGASLAPSVSVAPPVVAVPAPSVAPGVTATAAPGSAAAAGWIWPVEGPVTGKFDPQGSKGIEIAAPEDAPVVAVADGVVSYTGSPRDYGNLVILKHGDELLSVYAHNKTLLVKEGQAVHRGQTIATAGRSANVPATLHFEIRRNHVPIDPLEMLPLR